MSRRKASRSKAQEFRDYFAERLGERWARLEPALKEPKKKCSLIPSRSPRASDLIPPQNWEWVSEYHLKIAESQLGMDEFYTMDPASLIPVLAMPDGGEKILDMCAAPGGKSLALIMRFSEVREFVLNELSPDRRARLTRVIKDHLSKDEVMQKVRITGHDASRWCLYEKDAFDRILLDVPCSGEAYLLKKESQLEQWSLKRTKGLSIRQYAILASAAQVVRVGGYLVYSTCSISHIENDEVIGKLLERREKLFEVKPLRFPVGEPTQHGWQVWPDQGGFGPIYTCLIKRVG